jgi:hypothetical protein
MSVAAFSHVAFGKAFAAPMSAAPIKGYYLPLEQTHYRGIAHRSPWQAPYHVSHRYRGGAGARMGLVAQGIIPPPRYSYYDYPGFYWNNYFYYPNYRMIYDF